MATQQPQADDPTIGRLVHDATETVSVLVRKEIQLAKAELKVSVRVGAVSIGLFVVAAYLVSIGFVILSIAAAYFIHWNGSGLALHWAFLIVFGAWFLLAALLGLVGYRRIQKVKGVPRASRQAKQIPQALRGKS